VPSNWQKEYADAIDEVERRRKSGQMTEGEALVWKQRLLTEMDSQLRPTFARIGSRLSMVLVVLIAVLAVLAFIF